MNIVAELGSGYKVQTVIQGTLDTLHVLYTKSSRNRVESHRVMCGSPICYIYINGVCLCECARGLLNTLFGYFVHCN